MHPAGAIANPLRNFNSQNPPFVILAHLAALHFGASHRPSLSYSYSYLNNRARTLQVQTTLAPGGYRSLFPVLFLFLFLLRMMSPPKEFSDLSRQLL